MSDLQTTNDSLKCVVAEIPEFATFVAGYSGSALCLNEQLSETQTVGRVFCETPRDRYAEFTK